MSDVLFDFLLTFRRKYIKLNDWWESDFRTTTRKKTRNFMWSISQAELKELELTSVNALIFCKLAIYCYQAYKMYAFRAQRHRVWWTADYVPYVTFPWQHWSPVVTLSLPIQEILMFSFTFIWRNNYLPLKIHSYSNSSFWIYIISNKTLFYCHLFLQLKFDLILCWNRIYTPIMKYYYISHNDYPCNNKNTPGNWCETSFVRVISTLIGILHI